jgi:hypothetical protein
MLWVVELVRSMSLGLLVLAMRDCADTPRTVLEGMHHDRPAMALRPIAEHLAMLTARTL